MIFDGSYQYRVQGHNFDSMCWLTIPSREVSPAISDLVGSGIIMLVSELPDNPGMSICNAHEFLRAKICGDFDIPGKDVVYLEHWPAWTFEEGGYDRETEQYHLVKLAQDRYPVPQWVNLGSKEVLELKRYLQMAQTVDSAIKS